MYRAASAATPARLLRAFVLLADLASVIVLLRARPLRSYIERCS